ncbi:glycosyltransferase [Arthrobacter sp. P2b]|uniref:glycosyltransferase n=1 Tax=Arthrobacter sp. P2b TaxID=1938741 RepID=UPI0009A5E5A2|nr:glycosyltransferase [Arthrobacter sp. P2b]SLK00109.1 Glycosyltransferase, catalytic subunit of cellulose synthase and poly-beta-1,6-N-acetylglucosamine synthase [Arthrobacter sp. P2b]
MSALIFFLLLGTVLLFTVCVGTLWWMLHAWRTPENYESTNFATDSVSSQRSFSIIVPCRDEPYEVMTATVQRLLDQTHSDVEIVISVGDDDVDTVDRARMLAALHPQNIKVSVNSDPVKNKPRQLNSALQLCTGDIVGIIDAESLTAPGLLDHIDGTFQLTGADVVQGAVHLINYRSRWFTLRNCLEYRIWFRSRLHGHAVSGFIPLGGNTVFVWRHLLEEVGGWDDNCLAEDCEIGVRLSALGKHVVCVYDPALTTLEEAPTTVKAFIKQRTRWSLGFMQVLAKGEWKKLPSWQRRMSGWWTLVQQYAMALAGVLLPIAFLTAIAFSLPTGIVLTTYVPLIPLMLTVIFEVLVLREFGRDMNFKIGVRDYILLVVSTPFYQGMLLYAAVAAVVKFRRRNFIWDKTPHTGTHLNVFATSIINPPAEGAKA